MCSSSASSGSSVSSASTGSASPGSSPGSPRLSWNCSVKVLGYYLSDEERQLKRQWSAENHERMVLAKKELRRSKLGLAEEPCAAEACVKPCSGALASAALSAGGMTVKPRLATGSWLLPQTGEPSVKAKTSPPPGSNGRVLFSASTELEVAAPGQERTPTAARAVPFVPRFDEDAGELSKACANECDRLTLECENVTGRAVQLLSSISATVLAKMHQALSWTIEKDDAAALTALRNLLVPPLE